MGLLIMAVAVTVICFIISNLIKAKGKSYEVEAFFTALAICGLIVIGILLIIAGVAGAGSKQTRHSYQATYDNLIARVERCDPSDTTLWHDVQEYNENVTGVKYWRNSFWTNIYTEKSVLEFDEIEIPANLEEPYEQETVEKSVQE